jgi:hypothetical protein
MKSGDVITVSEAINFLEQGYREASEFPLINAPRQRVHSRNGVRISKAVTSDRARLICHGRL